MLEPAKPVPGTPETTVPDTPASLAPSPPQMNEPAALDIADADGATRDAIEAPAPVDGLESSRLSTKWVIKSSEPSQNGAVVVNPDAISVTDSFPPKPLNFIMIFGPSKSGKSFFMNALARRDGIFDVSPAAIPCTSGVDLSKTVVSLQGFTGTTTHVDSECTPCIGFVDVEGLGDRNPAHHVKLAIPPMLVSKVIIFNVKEVQRTTALDTLAVLRTAAKAVAPAESQEAYGHLIILVRDTYDNADEIYCMLFGVEEPDEEATHEDIEELEMRNLTRKKLKNIFKDIKVWCLPQPHADINENRSFALSDLKPEFHAKLDGLRKYMSGILTNPHKFGGRNIAGGVTLQPLVMSLCAAVSESKEVKPLSMMEGIEVQVAEELSNIGNENFGEALADFYPADVWSVEAMEDLLRRAQDDVLAEFVDATKDLQERGLEVAKKSLEQRIDAQAGMYRAAMDIDRIRMDESVRILNDAAFAQVEKQVSSVKLPITTPVAMWTKLCDSTFSRLQVDVAQQVNDVDLLPHVPAVLNRAEFEVAIQDKFERFYERNSLEQKVQDAAMDRKEAEDFTQKVLAIEARHREALERKFQAQAEEHSKSVKELEESLRRAEERSNMLEGRLRDQRTPQPQVTTYSAPSGYMYPDDDFGGGCSYYSHSGGGGGRTRIRSSWDAYRSEVKGRGLTQKQISAGYRKRKR
ncbi:unnamed protein product [Ectocarpus sp. 12 AP-2014]